MKNINSTIILILSVFFSVSCLAGDIPWGASPDHIKHSEQQQLLEEKTHALTYEASFLGQRYHLEYLFNSDLALVEKLYYQTLAKDDANCQQQFQHTLKQLQQHYGDAHNQTDKTTGCDDKTQIHWRLDKQQTLTLSLDSWKGQPYIGLRFNPATVQ